LRRVFAILATVQVLAVVAQFFLAAGGAYDTASKDTAFAPHRSLAMGILLFAIVLTIVGALARMPGRLIGMTALVAGLVVVQSLIRVLADSLNGTDDTTTTAGKLVFGLHALNGLFILLVTGDVARRARALARATADGSTGADGAVAGGAR
jgi:hypothetical protein